MRIDAQPPDDERPGRWAGGHQLALLEGGAQLFPAMAAAIDAAQRLVRLETYIFQFGGDALRVAEALERAAARGVVVQLVIDGVGSPHVPTEWQARFVRAGVRWRHYQPLGRLGLLLPSRWRRLHRKLCVVDDTVGFCGGINLIDDLDDVALGRLRVPRLDFSLRVVGPLVADMVATMDQLWWRLQLLRRTRQREFRAAWQALQQVRRQDDLPQWLRQLDWHWRERLADAPMLVDEARAALVLRDNLTHRHRIERAYLKAIGEARHEILLANAYFIPGRRLRKALLLALARGVRVRLLLQGEYEHFLQYHAARPVLHALASAGVEVMEYAPSALHAKVAVVDGRWATVGSSNLDPLSLLLAREANVMTTDPRFAQALHQRLDAIMVSDARALDAAALAARPWQQRVLDRVAYGIMRTVLWLTGHRY
jgi:cardiolipin synthase